jgi:hypothetical protein
MFTRRVERHVDDGGNVVTGVGSRLPTGERVDEELQTTVVDSYDDDAENTAVTDEETVVYAPNSWDLARGWVRTLTLWVALGLVIVETLLAFRFGFLLANANQNNGFVDFIYDTSDPLAEPFEGIASTSAVDGGVFDPATLIAMIVYAVAAVLVLLVIWASTAGPASTSGRRIASRSHWSAREDPHGHR